MAKSDPENDGLWLPLWMHLADTAGVMRLLINNWIPASVIRASGMNHVEFIKASVFTAAVHDIGKATSYFQSIIGNPWRNQLTEEGMLIRDRSEYRFSGKTPHSYAGQWILQSDETGIGIRSDIADVVGAHHGRPVQINRAAGEQDLIKVYEINFFGEERNCQIKERWKAVWRRIVEKALKEAGFKDVNELPVLNAEAQVLISGLLIVADWIASNTEYFPLILKNDSGSDTLYPARIEEGFARASFPERWNSKTLCMDEKSFLSRFGFLPNDVQKSVVETVGACETPGVFILEAQMGVGKTEAGLAAAEILAERNGSGGIFFGLPTQATSNGLFGRLYSWAASVSEDTANAIRLAHGASELNEEYAQLMKGGRVLVDNVEDSAEKGLEVYPWFQGNKKALLADFVIGTVDQFLMASLRRKHFMLRHLGLAGKIIIIDECHAYDAYMNRYLDRSLQWMAAYGIPVVLLSATLPVKRRTELAEGYAKAYSRYHLGRKRPQIHEREEGWRKSEGYPLLTWTDGETICQRSIPQDVPHKEIAIERIGSLGETAALLDDALSEGGCACVILNTVSAAQEAYNILRERLGDARIILYHAQFTMPDRVKKEQELLRCMGKHSGEKERYQCVLIGTQVLEQSLDYDADIMISELCPMDLLLQRMGRLHRHFRSRPEKLKAARCLILTDADLPFGSGTEAVYGRYLLLRTWNSMQERVKLPDDIPVLVQKVYSEDAPMDESDDMTAAREEFLKVQKEKNKKAERYLLTKPPRGSIENILENPDETAESSAECRVRDSASSIEVLLMKRIGDKITFADKVGESSQVFRPDVTPDDTTGRRIAGERIRLPHVFAADWNLEKTTKELEERGNRDLPEWKKSPWIRDSLVLLLNEDGTTRLVDYMLSYNMEVGLTCCREE